MDALRVQTHQRTDTALRPRTSAAYLSKFKLYLTFINCYQLQLEDIDTTLVFLEFLAPNGSSSSSLTNYISAIRRFFKIFDLSDHCLNHRKIYLLIKSVSMNSNYKPRYKANFTVHILSNLVRACDTMSQGHVFKAAFLLAYFGFLRLSNIAPSSPASFDPTLHFLRGDIIFGPPGVHVIVKWAKAMSRVPQNFKWFKFPIYHVPPYAQ